MYPVDYLKLTNLREATPLTTLFVAGLVLDTAWQFNQVLLYMDFTKSSSTSMEWKIEFSPDNVNWYQECVESYSAGVLITREVSHQVVSANQAEPTQLYRFAIPINDRYVRVSAKGTGTMTSTSLTIKVAMGIN